jgi:hypothetical protein
MKTRALINGASPSFGPEALKVIGQAFDAAWASIADQFSADLSAARLKLVTILLTIANDDSRVPRLRE